MRTLYFALAIWIGALGAVDNMSYNGRYRNAIWHTVTQQAYRAQVEVKNFLDRSGLTSAAIARQ